MQISYTKQSISYSDINEVTNALKSKFITQGPLVNIFEKKLKKRFKCKNVVVVNNGSSALILAGKVLNWKRGDYIAVPPITFLSSVNAIEHLGARPLFIDINMKDYCMDADKLEEKLKKDKYKKIKSAIITDYGGQPADWKKFLRLKKKYGIKLINDNCHAIGSRIDNNSGYACKYADITTLSFHPAKAITTGEGGAVLSNDKNLYHRLKLLRSHGIERKEKKYWSYKMNELGYNFRLPDINCALGISQLKRLDKFIIKRRKIAKIYDNFFSKYDIFQIPKNISHNFNSYHLYPLLINFKKIKISKDFVIKKFLKFKIKLQVHYIPVNSQPFYQKRYSFKKKDFRNSIMFYDQELSLPIYNDLSKKNINFFLSTCKKIFNLKS